MCRWYIYIGKKINIYDIIYNNKHSIFKQSYQKKFTPFIESNNRDNEVNVDGFGLGWYNNNVPYLYLSIKTPWTDLNLKNISKILETNFIFAHIRGIKPFSNNYQVHEYNCHPFNYKNFLFMHNGDIVNFNKIKKNIILQLKDNIYNIIKGTTDSEHIFALFLNLLDEKYLNNQYIEVNIFKNYILKLIKLLNSFNNEVMSLNLAITDGKTIICTRYINSEKENPPSLYYKINNDNIQIASEPIDYMNDWILIGKNKLLIYNKNIKIENII
tara:strand:+ start:6257 stop:7069 length:813 start_codon:yes stop_codon:yes gene_type:complete